MSEPKKIVAIVDVADGNESVGTMWKETKIFEPDTPVIDIMKWAGDSGDCRKRNVIITVADN